MKIKIQLFLISLFVITACKKKSTNIYSQALNNSSKSNTEFSDKKNQKDIFIGKEFFSGDELNDVTTVKTDKTSVDSIHYSIYKDNTSDNYIFSLEKFLKNEDVEKFKIIDTVNLKSAEIELKEENVAKNRILSLKLDNRLIKNWSYNIKVNEKSSLKMLGSYSGRFLRMKEESGDPRGWGMIYIDVKKDASTFKLESYIEQVSKNLVILNQKKSEITLSLKGKKDSTFIIYKKGNQYFLKSTFINKTVGGNEIYNLVRK